MTLGGVDFIQVILYMPIMSTLYFDLVFYSIRRISHPDFFYQWNIISIAENFPFFFFKCQELVP